MLTSIAMLQSEKNETRRFLRAFAAQQAKLKAQNLELKAKKDRLEASHGLISDLFEFAPVGYLVLSSDRRILLLNATAEKLLGSPRSELVGRQIDNRMLRDDREIFRKRLLELSPKQNTYLDLRFSGPDSEIRWYSFELASARPSDGSEAYCRCILNDLSRCKNLKNQARLARLRVQKGLAASKSLRLAVEQRTEKLRVHHARQTDIQNRERSRLAGELHDRVGASLTSLGIHLTRLSSKISPENTKLLEECRDLVEEVTSRVRYVIGDLRIPTLDDFGLGESLRNELHHLFHGSGIVYECVASTKVQLPRTVEEQLLLIAREAMTNVLRHSRATKVKLALSAEDNRVALTVEDNGSGTVSRKLGCWGLLSMSERAQSIGAKLSIMSRPGLGTSIKTVLETSKTC